MKYILVFLFLAISTISYAQFNYNDLQSEITVTCGDLNYEKFKADKLFLDTLSTEEIDVGLKDFLLDKAWIYYLSYGFHQDEEDLSVSKNLFEQCWNEFQSKRALFNLIVITSFQQDCASFERLSKIFIEEFPDGKDESYHSDIVRMKKHCE